MPPVHFRFIGWQVDTDYHHGFSPIQPDNPTGVHPICATCLISDTRTANLLPQWKGGCLSEVSDTSKTDKVSTQFSGSLHYCRSCRLIGSGINGIISGAHFYWYLLCESL